MTLRPGGSPAKLLRLWGLQGQGERLVKRVGGVDSARLEHLGMIRVTPDGFCALTPAGRIAAQSLEASS